MFRLYIKNPARRFRDKIDHPRSMQTIQINDPKGGWSTGQARESSGLEAETKGEKKV